MPPVPGIRYLLTDPSQFDTVVYPVPARGGSDAIRSIRTARVQHAHRRVAAASYASSQLTTRAAVGDVGGGNISTPVCRSPSDLAIALSGGDSLFFAGDYRERIVTISDGSRGD